MEWWQYREVGFKDPILDRWDFGFNDDDDDYDGKYMMHCDFRILFGWFGIQISSIHLT